MTPSERPTLRLVCTDFDGTIHSEDESPSIAVEFQELIHQLQQRGVRWVVNTGRVLDDILRELERSAPRVSPDYLVVVEREIYVRDDRMFQGHRPWNDRCTQVHQSLFSQMRPLVAEWAASIRSKFRAEIYEDPWSPFCLVAANPRDAVAIVRQIEDWCRAWPEVVVVSNHVYARLSHVDYHKGSALGEVASLCGADAASTFVAGDHLNDLSMLSRRRAGWLMAPANAVSEVKAAVQREGGWIMEGCAGQAVAAGLRRCLEEVGWGC